MAARLPVNSWQRHYGAIFSNHVSHQCWTFLNEEGIEAFFKPFLPKRCIWTFMIANLLYLLQ